MEFVRHKPIFEQIAGMICKKIIEGNYAEGERIPSVRELASVMEVNPNTVAAAYTVLADEQIIINQRGIGYVTADGGKSLATRYMEKTLVHDELVRLLKDLKQLGMTEEKILDIFRKV